MTITLSDDNIAVLCELLTGARAWRPKLPRRLDLSQQKTGLLPAARHPALQAGSLSIGNRSASAQRAGTDRSDGYWRECRERESTDCRPSRARLRTRRFDPKRSCYRCAGSPIRVLSRFTLKPGMCAGGTGNSSVASRAGAESLGIARACANFANFCSLPLTLGG